MSADPAERPGPPIEDRLAEARRSSTLAMVLNLPAVEGPVDFVNGRPVRFEDQGW